MPKGPWTITYRAETTGTFSEPTLQEILDRVTAHNLAVDTNSPSFIMRVQDSTGETFWEAYR